MRCNINLLSFNTNFNILLWSNYRQGVDQPSSVVTDQDARSKLNYPINTALEMDETGYEIPKTLLKREVPETKDSHETIPDDVKMTQSNEAEPAYNTVSESTVPESFEYAYVEVEKFA